MMKRSIVLPLAVAFAVLASVLIAQAPFTGPVSGVPFNTVATLAGCSTANSVLQGGTTPTCTATPTVTSVTATANFAAGDGTVAAPSFAISSETNGTGFFRPAANQLAFSVNGVQQSTQFTNGFLATSQLFLGNTDTAISRVTTGQIGLPAVLFASLGTPANGTFAYCSNCTLANPCAGGGTGAFAKRLNAVWVCN